MAKVINFPVQSVEKFGLQRVRKKRTDKTDKDSLGQLDLFNDAKVIRLNQLSPFEEALILDEKGNKSRAKDFYLKAIEEGDCAADAHCNLAIIESQNGNYALAIDGFTQCLKHDPRHYTAHYNLANLYAELNNLSLAKVHYEIAIQIEPEFINSYFNLGLTLAMRKEFKEAIKVLDQYRKLTPAQDHKQVEELIQKLIMV